MRCCVQYCPNDTRRNNKSNGITFHLFPKPLELRTAWLESLGMSDFEPKERSCICSEHFRNEDIYETKAGLRRIKGGAVPVVMPETADDLDAPAALRVCRICLVMDTKMYHIREFKLDQMYEQITGLMASSEDRFPQRICWECAGRLSAANSFRNKALRSSSVMYDILQAGLYIKIRDIKKVNRKKHNLTTNLVQQIYEDGDFDLRIKDLSIKTEETREISDTIPIDTEEIDVKSLAPINDIEVKAESANNEIYFEAFDDNFDDDDDKVLSEVYVERKEVPQVKKKKDKVVRKLKQKKVEEDDDPDTATDRYKTNEIKRRRNVEFDESLFTITSLTYDEQIEEILKRQESYNYTSAPFKCTVCYRGFQIKDRFTAHCVRHTEVRILFTIASNRGAVWQQSYNYTIAPYRRTVCYKRFQINDRFIAHCVRHTEVRILVTIASTRGAVFQQSYNYTSAPYRRTVCYRGFQIKDRFTAHCVRHTEQCGAYECFICKTRLKTSRALRKHLTAQHTEQYSCKGCPFVTRNRGVAREHEKWHGGTKYQCPHCASSFDKITTYMGHIRIKHVSDFVCELCGYTFVSEKGIAVHKKKKHRVDKELTLEGPYCETCDVKFLDEEAHERHLKLSARHSSDHDPNRIRNDSQSMNAERNGRVMRRIERRPVIHPRAPSDSDQQDPQTPVNCEQCGIQLRDLRVYAQHFRRMHPDKNRTKYPAMKTPCMCEQCGKIFQSMALLKDHMWVHTGEKRFKCDRCTKSFTQKTNLVFHMRVHSSSRPSYECPLCGKHFAFFNNRRRHMFIHTGLKPFKCDTCGKSFTTAGEQRAHVEHVHMKKPWPKRARQRHRDWKCDERSVED